MESQLKVPPPSQSSFQRVRDACILRGVVVQVISTLSYPYKSKTSDQITIQHLKAYYITICTYW